MNHIDQYRAPERIRAIAAMAAKLTLPDSLITLMEVCGTHTMNIHRHGIRELMPNGVRLISGPGCPVCVTPRPGIDKAVAYARQLDTIVCSFGDMLRPPGSTSSLLNERANGADVRIVYSPLDAVKIAKENADKKVIFIGIGFETTAPLIAATIIQAKKEVIKNYKVLALGKLIPPAMDMLVSDERLKINGFLCAAHVSTIIGTKSYKPIAEKGIPCVVAGFEPVDIMAGIYSLLKQVSEGRSEVENEYSRIAKPEGNIKALEILDDVFEPADSEWLGIGEIPKSGLRIREKYSEFDAEAMWPVEAEATMREKGCRCGEILMGLIEPPECPLFANVCTPEMPHGACMVSSEGTCAAFYKYQKVDH